MANFPSPVSGPTTLGTSLSHSFHLALNKSCSITKTVAFRAEIQVYSLIVANFPSPVSGPTTLGTSLSHSFHLALNKSCSITKTVADLGSGVFLTS